jgi:hypothetical protein
MALSKFKESNFNYSTASSFNILTHYLFKIIPSFISPVRDFLMTWLLRNQQNFLEILQVQTCITWREIGDLKYFLKRILYSLS